MVVQFRKTLSDVLEDDDTHRLVTDKLDPLRGTMQTHLETGARQVAAAIGRPSQRARVAPSIRLSREAVNIQNNESLVDEEEHWLNSQITKLNQELAVAESNVQKLTVQYQSLVNENTELRAQNNDANVRLQQEQLQFSPEKQAAVNDEIRKLEESLEIAVNKAKSVQEEVNTVTDQLKAAEAEHKRLSDEYVRKIAELTNSLSQEKSILRQEKADNGSIRNFTTQLETELQQVIAERDFLEGQVNIFAEENKDLEIKVNRLQDLLESGPERPKAPRGKRSFRTLDNKINQLEGERAALKRQQTQNEKKIKELQQRIRKLENQLRKSNSGSDSNSDLNSGSGSDSNSDSNSGSDDVQETALALVNAEEYQQQENVRLLLQMLENLTNISVPDVLQRTQEDLLARTMIFMRQNLENIQQIKQRAVAATANQIQIARSSIGMLLDRVGTFVSDNRILLATIFFTTVLVLYEFFNFTADSTALDGNGNDPFLSTTLEEGPQPSTINTLYGQTETASGYQQVEKLLNPLDEFVSSAANDTIASAANDTLVDAGTPQPVDRPPLLFSRGTFNYLS